MSHNMAQDLRVLFVSGRTINADADASYFNYLESDPHAVSMINEFLSGLGVKIVKTSSGRSWIPVWTRLDDNSRKSIEKTVADHKKIFRHIVGFFRLSIGAISHGQIPQGGAILRMSTMSENIHSNSHLIDRLKVLAARIGSSSSGGDSVQSMVLTVISWAKKNQLITEENTVTGEYRFTGKVDWINDMNAAFEECIEVPVEVEVPTNLPLF